MAKQKKLMDDLVTQLRTKAVNSGLEAGVSLTPDDRRSRRVYCGADDGKILRDHPFHTRLKIGKGIALSGEKK